MLIEPIELCSNLTFENILAKVAFKLIASSRYYWNSFAGVCMSCWAVGIGVSIHKVSSVELRVLGKCLNIWSNIIRCNKQLHLIIAAESCSFSIRLCITQSANWFDVIAAWICNILCDRASGRYTRYRVKRSIFGDENCNLSMRWSDELSSSVSDNNFNLDSFWNDGENVAEEFAHIPRSRKN